MTRYRLVQVTDRRGASLFTLNATRGGWLPRFLACAGVMSSNPAPACVSRGLLQNWLLRRVLVVSPTSHSVSGDVVCVSASATTVARQANSSPGSGQKTYACPPVIGVTDGARGASSQFCINPHCMVSAERPARIPINTTTAPEPVNGLRLGTANASLFLVAAELIASPKGLGFLLIDSQNAAPM
jgi:hypothetical protein